MLLIAENIFASYNKKPILYGVNLQVKCGEIVTIIGPNGSGKSTLLKVLAGHLKTEHGKITFNNENITLLEPHQHINKGIAYLIQGGKVFPSLAVQDNLRLAGLKISKKEFTSNIQWIYELFPKLRELKTRRAGLLSGGEKQMLAISMILVHKPKLLLLDEPSAGGLTPLLSKEVFTTIKRINDEEQISIILVEQNIREAISIAHSTYFMKNGKAMYCENPLKNLTNVMFEELIV